MNAVQQIVGATALFVAAPCLAHHSYAMFDMARTVTLRGTVKQFQWSNPHCYLQLLLPAQNASAEWSIEMGSTGAEYRDGWRPGTLKPGDKVTVVVWPVKDGTNGGRFVSAMGADGESLGMRKTP